MSDQKRPSDELPEHAPVKDEVEARQAVTGHNVRYVLAVSFVLTCVAMLVVWLVA
ncbi:MAG: hypothetical protein ACREDZ_07305 [Kiloniellales bacterium]